jgi:nitroreductase
VGVLDMMRGPRAGDAKPSPLLTRRSIRKYLDKPVPDDLVGQVLVEARWAPSAINTQSTYVFVLSGKPFEKFKADLRKYSEDNAPVVSDLPMGPQWTPHLEGRIKELMETRSSWCAAEEKRLGLAPSPPPANPMVAGAAIHGAPLMLVLAFEKAISVHNGCFDAGLLAMAITLAAHERGLGTCIVGSAVRYSELLRKRIPELEDKNVVIGIAMGYPDLGAPVNRFPRSRVLLKEFVTFVK